MPYEVRDNCVHKKGEDKPIPGGCHGTPKEAYAHMAAIEHNEGKAVSLSGFKSLGDGRWVGFFSNFFYDRDIKPDAPRGERFTLDALKEASEWMNSGNLPVLELFHLDGLQVGKATDTYVAGPFIIAEGVWNDDEIGRKAREFFDKSDENWRMSHGFGYFAKDRIGGEYHRFRPHELTILTEKWAANPITLFKEADMAGFKDDVVAMVAEVLHLKPDEAKAKVEEEFAKAGKALAEGELPGKKDGEETAPVAEADAPTLDGGEPAAAKPPAAEPKTEEDATVEAVANQLVEALSELSAARTLAEQLAKDVKALQLELAAVGEKRKGEQESLEARIKALEEADEERVKMLPKAVKAALEKRASGDSAVDTKKAEADISGREAGLKGEVPLSADPVGFIMKKAGAA